MRAAGVEILLVTSVVVACGEETGAGGAAGTGGEAGATFECAGDESSPIQCVSGKELCVVYPAEEEEPYEGIPPELPTGSDEYLKCFAYPDECSEWKDADPVSWCECVAELVCTDCDHSWPDCGDTIRVYLHF